MTARTEAALSGATMGLLVGMGGSLLGAYVTGETRVWFLIGQMVACTLGCGAVAWLWAIVTGGEE